MKNFIFVLLLINLLTSSVWADCSGYIDMVQRSYCEQSEYRNKMLQMNRQQLEMQRQALNGQQGGSKQDCWSGVLKVDYFRYMTEARQGRVPWMSKEEFAEAYKDRYQQ